VRFEDPAVSASPSEAATSSGNDARAAQAPSPLKAETSEGLPSFWSREPPQVYALAGAGIVATGLWAYFGLSGLAARSELEQSQCKPNCDRDAASSAKSKLLAADISLLAGLGAFGGAVWFHFDAHKREAAPTTALQWFVAPVRGGAEGSVAIRY
jgi:hypothetical protein